MAGNDNYKFGLDIDIGKAMSALNRVNQEVDRLSGKKVNNNDQLNQNEYNNVARDMNSVVEALKGIEEGMIEAGRRTKDMNDTMKFTEATKDLETMRAKLARVNEEYRRMGKNLGTSKSFQYDSKRYLAGQQRDSASYRGIGRDNLKGFKERMSSESTRVSRVKGDGDRLLSNMQNTGYLNHNEMKKLMSTMGQLKVLRDVRGKANTKDIQDREDQLKSGDKRIQELQSKESLSKAERDELNATIEKVNIVHEEIKVLEKFQRTIERATKGLEELESTSGVDIGDVGSDKFNNSVKPRKLEQVKPERGTAMGMAYERAPSLVMGVVAVTGGVVASQYNKGGNLKEQMLDDNLSLGTQTGNFDYHGLRKEQEKAGLNKQVNMSGTEMLKAQAEYMNRAGFTSQEDLNSATTQVGRFSRGMGVSVDEATQNTSVMAQYMNGSNASSIKQMQNMFAGGLKASGMVGQNKQQLSALDTLVSTIGSTTSLDKDDMTQLLGLQANLAGTGEKSLQGEQGAKLLSDLNAGVQASGGNALAVSLAQRGNPQRYASGMAGMNQLSYDLSEGITGEAFSAQMKAIMQQTDFVGGSDSEKAGFLIRMSQNALGTNMNAKQAEGIMGLYESGNMDPVNIKKVMEEGESSGSDSVDKNASSYSESSTATETKYANALDAQATAVNDLGTAYKALLGPVYGATGAFGVVITASLAMAGAMATASASMLGAGALRSFIGGKTAKKASSGGAGGGGGGTNSRVANRGGSGGGGGAGGFMSSKIGKSIPIIGTVATLGFGAKALSDTAEYDKANNVSDKEHKSNMGSIIGSTGGGIAGGVAGGALAGSAIGSVVPFAGTAIGGILGAVGGGIAGSSLGGWIGDKVGGWFGKDEKAKEDTATVKKDESNSEKKASVEEQRAQNISRDEKFVKEYKDAMQQAGPYAGSTRAGVSGSSSYSETSTSNTENSATNTSTDNLAESTSSSATANSSRTSSTVAVNVTHDGSVSAITSGGKELTDATNNAIAQSTGLFKSTLPNGNQFKIS